MLSDVSAEERIYTTSYICTTTTPKLRIIKILIKLRMNNYMHIW